MSTASRPRAVCSGMPRAGDGVALQSAHDELVLDQLRETWAGIYDVGFADGAPRARRLTGDLLLTADTPAGLASAIWADWTRSRRARGFAR